MRKSSLFNLPKEIREKLEQKLFSNGFQDYRGLGEWLQGQGYEISNSAIHRHGKKLQERAESVRLVGEQAKALIDAADDNEDAVNEALAKMVQQKAFQAILNEDAEGDVDITRLSKVIADLSRASVGMKKFKQDTAEKRDALAREVVVDVALRTVEIIVDVLTKDNPEAGLLIAEKLEEIQRRVLIEFKN